jgi:hypothetical protein
MSEPFIPTGYKKITDLKSDDLRRRLADGELQAFVQDVTGDLIAIAPKYWHVPSCQTWLDSGLFYDNQWRQYFPIFVKLAEPPIPEPADKPSHPTGPKPIERERVKAEMRDMDREELRRMKQEELAARFGSGSRKMKAQARKEVLAETGAKPAQNRCK